MLILLNTLNSKKIGAFMTSAVIPDTAKVSLIPAFAFKWGVTADNAYPSVYRSGGFYVSGNNSTSANTFYYSSTNFYSNRQSNPNAVVAYVDSAFLKYSITTTPTIKISKYVLNFLYPSKKLTEVIKMDFANLEMFVSGAISNLIKFEPIADNFFFSTQSEYTITEPTFKFEVV